MRRKCGHVEPEPEDLDDELDEILAQEILDAAFARGAGKDEIDEICAKYGWKTAWADDVDDPAPIPIPDEILAGIVALGARNGWETVWIGGEAFRVPRHPDEPS